MKNKPDLPLITIAITCYNYAEYVGGAIKSALNQTYPNIKVMVYNDGSTDNSLAEINNFANDKRLKIVSQTNKGIVYTRNRAIEEAEGEYLIFLDADNVFPDTFVENLFNTAVMHSADVVYSDMLIMAETTKQYHYAPEFDLGSLLVYNYIDISALIKLDSIKDARFDPKMDELTHEDWDFFIELAARGLKFKKARNGAHLLYRSKVNSRNLAFTKSTTVYEERQKWYAIIAYIISKQRLKNPMVFNNVRDEGILIYKSWYDNAANDAIRLQHHIEGLQHHIEGLQHHIEGLQNTISAIKSSRAYRVANILLYLPRKIKGLVSE